MRVIHILNKQRFLLAGNSDGADAIPAHQKASNGVWDETYRRYRYYDGNGSGKRRRGNWYNEQLIMKLFPISCFGFERRTA
jgi:hypothetical protein